MVEAKELRVGNLVLFKSSIVTVLGVDAESSFNIHIGDDYYGDDEIDPIPINPEWLERLGFEKKEAKKGFSYHNNLVSVSAEDENWDDLWLDSYFKGMYIGVNPCYVHRLQNLYFALTGSELTVKT